MTTSFTKRVCPLKTRSMVPFFFIEVTKPEILAVMYMHNRSINGDFFKLDYRTVVTV